MNCKGTTKKTVTIILLILAASMCLTFVMATAFVSPIASTSIEQVAPAKIWTDKADYHPGEVVTIFGSGFLTNTNVDFVVTKLKDNTTTNWSPLSDASGNLTTTYQIDPQGAPLYRIDATDGTNNATITFTDSGTVSIKDQRTGVTVTTMETLAAQVGDILEITGYSDDYFNINFDTFPYGPGVHVHVAENFTGGASSGIQYYTIPNIPDGSYMAGVWNPHPSESPVAYAMLTVTSPNPIITFQLSGMSSDYTNTVLNIGGTTYTYSQFPITASWTEGSTHTITATSSAGVSSTKQYGFSSWTNGNGLTAASGTFTTPSSDTTVTLTYKEQYPITPYYTVTSGSPSVSNTVHYTSAGVSQTATPTLGSTGGSTIWVDYGTAITYKSPIAGAANERWQIASSDTTTHTVVDSVSAGGDITATYYHQYKFTLRYLCFSGWPASGSGTQPSITAKLYGSDYVQAFTTSATDYWVDAGSWSVTQVLDCSNSTERWATSQATTGTLTAPTYTQFNYYHQLLQTLSYEVSGDGVAPPSAPVVNSGSQFGAAYTPALTTTPAEFWFDSSGGSYLSVEIPGIANERWRSDTLDLGIVNSAVISIYHQYQVPTSFVYTTQDGSAIPENAIIGTAYCYGSTNTIRSGTSYGSASSASTWADAGINTVTFGTYTINSGKERWVLASPQSFDVTSSDPITVNYYHQYAITPYYTFNDAASLALQSSPNATGVVHYTSIGASQTGTPTKGASGGTPIWVDNGTAISYTSPIAGATGERWQIASADSELHEVLAAVNASRTITAAYYHQYLHTLSYQIAGDGVAPPVSMTLQSDGTQFGATYQPSVTTTPTQYWFDTSNTGIESVSLNSISGTANDRWHSNKFFENWRSDTVVYTIYHQFRITQTLLTYTTQDGSKIPTSQLIGTVYQWGSVKQLYSHTFSGVATPAYLWIDAGVNAVTFNTYTNGTERWALTSPQTFDVLSNDTITVNYYHQYQQTLSYQIIGGGSPFTTPCAAGTQFGGAYSPTLTTAATGYWFDASGTITFSNINGATGERWSPTTTSISATSVNTQQATWYHQYAITLYYTASKGTINVNNAAHYTSSGAAQTATPTLGETGGTPLWMDAGTAVTYDSPIAATATERWQIGAGDTTTHTVLASVSVSRWVLPTYYHQYLQTLSYQIVSGTAPSAPTVADGNQFGSTYAPTLTTSPTGYWFDDANWLGPNNIAGAANERWTSNDNVDSDTVNTAVFHMYHQYHVTFGYTTQDSSAIPQYQLIGTILYGGELAGLYSGTSYGSALSEGDNWVDAGVGSVTYNTYTDAGSTERWALSSPHSFDVTGTGTITETGYYHQVYVTFKTHTNDGSIPTADFGSGPQTIYPYINFVQYGQALLMQADPDSIGDYFDIGSAYSYESTNQMPDGATERWHNNAPPTGTITADLAGETFDPAYVHQYQVSFAVTPSGSGTTTPSDNLWHDAGTTLSVSATQNPGYTFSAWSSADSITFDNASAAGTTATISGPGTITAAFTQNPVTHFDFSIVGAQTAGTSFSVTVTAKDAFGNTIPWYTGTVHFSSNDNSAVLPTDYTFQTGDSGVKTFTVTLKTAGTNAITAAEATNSSVNGSSGNIAVTHATAVSSIAITPAISAITAGTTKTFTATATDAYGNTWDITSSTTWSINNTAHGIWSSNIYTSETAGTWTVQGTYGSNTATATLTVNPATVDHFTISTPDSITVSTPFDITITALDAYGNKATGFNEVVTFTPNIGVIYPSTSNTFTEGIWTGPVSLSSWGSVTITASDGSGHSAAKTLTVQGPSSSSTSTPSPSISPTPTPTPDQNVIHATTSSGTVDIPITGNISATQVTSATITTTADKIVLSFNLSGQSGTTGFSNMTIPKSAVPSGTSPIVYIDGAPAENQGYTQDANNYYVWYTTHFSSHNITVEFANQQQSTASPTPTQPQTETSLWVYLVFIVTIALATIGSVFWGYRKTKSP